MSNGLVGICAIEICTKVFYTNVVLYSSYVTHFVFKHSINFIV
jgi:hypothetical protein